MNDFEKQFQQIATKMKEERENSQLTLGEFIEKLESCKKDAIVYIKPFELNPCDLSSYRGYYEDLAIEYNMDVNQTRVKDLLEWCKSAVGKTYTGYKGGKFIMNENTPLWVSNYGESSQMAVMDIEKLGDNWVYIIAEEKNY